MIPCAPVNRLNDHHLELARKREAHLNELFQLHLTKSNCMDDDEPFQLIDQLHHIQRIRERLQLVWQLIEVHVIQTYQN